jgi:hypothetical protein
MKEGAEPGPPHIAPSLCAMITYFLSIGISFLGGDRKKSFQSGHGFYFLRKRIFFKYSQEIVNLLPSG